MKWIIVVSACLTLAFLSIGAQAASAHPTRWGVTPARAAQDIYRNDISWADGEYDIVIAVQCHGIGYNFRSHGLRLYKHLHCYVETTLGEDPFWVVYHVTGAGRNNWRVAFLRYA